MAITIGMGAYVYEYNIDADQNVYVTDQIPRLSILNLNGELLARGRTFENGHDVYSDSHCDLYAVDVTNNRVQKIIKIH